MDDESNKGSGCLNTGLLIISALVLLPVLYVADLMIPRHFADSEVDQICKKLGGIRVFETVKLAKGQFATPDETSYVRYGEGRRILGDYQIVKTSKFSTSHGFSVYQFDTWIERLSDHKHLSEMTTFLRDGDEVLHGHTCPSGISEEDLIHQTFLGDGPSKAADIPVCQDETAPIRLKLRADNSGQSKLLTGYRPELNRPFLKSKINCVGRTEFALKYSEVKPGEVALAATVLQFESKSGGRCRVEAMGLPDRIICTDNSIWLVGTKTISGRGEIVVQKYGRAGTLIAEATLENSTVYGRIVGYNESPSEVAIDIVRPPDQHGRATCHRITASKVSLGSDDWQVTVNDEIAAVIRTSLPGCEGLRTVGLPVARPPSPSD